MTQIKSLKDAYLYILDCQLATVDYMTSLKRKDKIESERQISIAQKMLNWAEDFEVEIDQGNRAETVITKYNGDVKAWTNRLLEIS